MAKVFKIAHYRQLHISDGIVATQIERLKMPNLGFWGQFWSNWTKLANYVLCRLDICKKSHWIRFFKPKKDSKLKYSFYHTTLFRPRCGQGTKTWFKPDFWPDFWPFWPKLVNIVNYLLSSSRKNHYIWFLTPKKGQKIKYKINPLGIVQYSKNCTSIFTSF